MTSKEAEPARAREQKPPRDIGLAFRDGAEVHAWRPAAQQRMGKLSDNRLVPISSQRGLEGYPPVTRWPQSLFLLHKHHKEGKSGFFSVQSLFTAKYRVCGHLSKC